MNTSRWLPMVCTLFLACEPAIAELLIRAVDVGYGEAYILQARSRNKVLWTGLIDSGPSGASSALLRELQQMRAARVDDAFLSHPHPNHCEGFGAVMGQTSIQRFYWGDAREPDPACQKILMQLQENGSAVEILNSRHAPLEREGVRIDVLHPLDAGGSLHEQNLVLLVSYGAVAILFAGDLAETLQADVMQEVLEVVARRGQSLQLATWPHHGDDLAPAWEKALDEVPYVVLSVGPNVHGLPKGNTNTTLQSRAMRTDREGSMTFSTDGRTLRRISTPAGNKN